MAHRRRPGASWTCYAARLLQQALAAADALKERARIVETLVGALCSMHAGFWCGLSKEKILLSIIYLKAKTRSSTYPLGSTQCPLIFTVVPSYDLERESSADSYKL
jgi:hypothetical protein